MTKTLWRVLPHSVIVRSCRLVRILRKLRDREWHGFQADVAATCCVLYAATHRGGLGSIYHLYLSDSHMIQATLRDWSEYRCTMW